jgi:tryptophan synthase alpha chain
MMRSISQAFSRARSKGRAAFIPFITAGFPNRSTFQEILIELDKIGSDIIEVGAPFSDPLADGPTIQQASSMALKNGVTTDSTLEMVHELKGKIQAPLVAMTYYNPILRMGNDSFAANAAQAGFSGVIIPDLPPEEADDWLNAARNSGLATIFLTAITSPISRKKLAARLTSGFLYYVSMTGVTGSKLTLSQETLDDIRMVKELSDKPVAVGFGVSTPEHAGIIGSVADGVIVGSALLKRIMESEEGLEQVESVRSLALELKAAIDGKGSWGLSSPPRARA